jgi:hypothetical protein
VSAKKRQAPIERKAYTLAEAAAVCGVGITVIKEAADRGELIKRYPTSRPVILADELEAWLRSLPSERRT